MVIEKMAIATMFSVNGLTRSAPMPASQHESLTTDGLGSDRVIVYLAGNATQNGTCPSVSIDLSVLTDQH